MQARQHHLYVFVIIGFIGFSLVSVGIGWQLIFKKSFMPLSELDQEQFASIQERCAASIQPDGFGLIELTKSITIENETSTLPTPCKIMLATGVHLAIINTNLTSNNLLISSTDKANVTIEGSSLTGKDAGLQVSLQGADSKIAIADSTFDYDLSIGLAAGSTDEDMWSKLSITNAQFTVEGQDSEGVTLAATGSASVIDSTFTSFDSEDQAFLLAPECTVSNSTGINSKCQAQ